jgi:chromosome segregation ATPase
MAVFAFSVSKIGFRGGTYSPHVRSNFHNTVHSTERIKKCPKSRKVAERDQIQQPGVKRNKTACHAASLSFWTLKRSGQILLSKIRTEFGNARSEFDNLLSEFNSLRSEFDNLRSQFNSLRSEFDSLRSQFNSLRNEFNSLRNYFNSLRSEFKSLRSEFDSLRDHFNSC